MFSRGDDNYGSIALNFDFKYFDYSFTQVTLDTNGYVYFSGPSCCGITAPTDSRVISALNYDLDTLKGGGIYYQNVNVQSNDFDLIRTDLNRLNASFVPANIFRITFDNVATYSTSSLKASFQLILASDASSTSSYVALKYTSCLSNSVNLRSSPGLYYLNSNGQQESFPISEPCSSTNVNSIGTWVFDVSTFNGSRFIQFL